MSAFARLEARTNAAVVRHLANRVVTFGALSFGAIFEDAGALEDDGMVETTQPRLMAVGAAVAAQLDRGSVLTITNPATGEVITHALARSEPDGAGFFTLYLRD